MGIRTYLAALAAALLAPLLLLSAWSLTHVFEVEKATALRQVHEQARELARVLDDEFVTAQAVLRMLAASPYLANGDIERFRSEARAAQVPDGSAIRLVCAAGVTSSAQGIDVHTSAIAGTSRDPQPSSAVRTQVSPVRDSGVARSAQVLAIDLSVPLGTRADECRLALSFESEALQRWIAARKLPDDWTVAVFDRGLAPVAQRRPPQGLAPASMQTELRDAALRNAEGHVQSTPAGGIGRYDIYTRAGRTGWIVDIAVPAAAIEATARRAVPWTIAAILASAGIAAGVVFVLGRRLRRSWESLNAAAGALGREEKLPAHVSSIQEVDALRATLERTQAELERMRSERTEADAEQRRDLEAEREAKEAAELQNRAKDHFMAMLGHELRSPLNAISGAISIIARAAVTADDAARARDVIARQAKHLSRIVDELLDLGGLMTGKTPLAFESVDLAELCRSTVAGLQGAGRIEDDAVTIHAEPIRLQADPVRLGQAIGILVMSASKQGTRGPGVELRLTADLQHARLVVRSATPGIPEHLSGDVPDAETEREPSLDPTQGGPSIGLGIAERLVALHGGQIEMRFPQKRRSSEFIVRLPLGDASPAPAVPDGVTSSRRLRVLVVDDHDDSRAMLCLMLRHSGHDTMEAVDGIEGVQHALAACPDAAIVDIGLPGIDGYEVARRLRKLPNGSRTALIALTGYGQIEDRERALRAGFDRHLVKPVDEQQLQAALNEATRPASDSIAGGRTSCAS